MIKFRQHDPKVLIIPFIIYLSLFFGPLSSKAHNNFFYLVILVPFVLFIRVKKEDLFNVIKSKGFILVFILVSYLALTVFLNMQFVSLSEIVKPFRHWFSFMVFFFLCVLLFSKYDLEEKMNYVSLWAAIWGGLSILLFFYDKPFAQRLLFYGRVESPIFGACTYATLFLFLMFSEKKTGKALRICALSILLLSIIFAQSRGPILALSVAVVAGLIGQSRKIMPFIIGGSGIVLWVLDYLKIISCGRIFWAHSSFRIPIWKQVISESINSGAWLFGHGIAVNETVTITPALSFPHAHSGYVGTFFIGGIIGVVLLLNLAVHIARQSLTIKSVRENGLAISLVVFALLSIATDTHILLKGPHPTWFFFWLPVAYLVAEEIKNSAEQ